MKRVRRVTLEIRHQSFSIIRTETHSMGPSESPSGVSPKCDVCGAPCVRVVREAEAPFESAVQEILDSLLQRGMHAHVSDAGQLWVCCLSFQNMSENL